MLLQRHVAIAGYRTVPPERTRARLPLPIAGAVIALMSSALWIVLLWSGETALHWFGID